MSQTELTLIIFNMELSQLGLETSNWQRYMFEVSISKQKM